ncbi:MAG TPA: phage holin family protein [Steroidobacteraceae bacterium]|jgi:uncharacterized membrane protein YqjE
MADGADGTDHELDEEAPGPAPGAFRGLASAVLDVLKTRLDLVAVEAEIYLLRTMQTLLWALAALACALLGFVFVIVAVIAALWDTHRMAGVLGAAGLFVLLAAVFGYVAARTFRFRPMVLDKTLQQLEHDRDRVNGGAE